MAFTNNVINGGDILLYIGSSAVPGTADQLIGCATTHSIEITNAVREVSCKGSGDWTSAEYGRFSWSISIDALVNLSDMTASDISHYQELVTLMLNKTIIAVRSEYDQDANGDGVGDGTDTYTLSGEAIITSISKNASDNENASYSVQLQGRGELTQTIVNP